MSNVLDGPNRTAEAMRKVQQASGETIPINVGDLIWMRHCLDEFRRETEGRLVPRRAISALDSLDNTLKIAMESVADSSR
jgi:hypothetical protein